MMEVSAKFGVRAEREAGGQGDRTDFKTVEDAEMYCPVFEPCDEDVDRVVLAATVRGVEDCVNRSTGAEDVVAGSSNLAILHEL